MIPFRHRGRAAVAFLALACVSLLSFAAPDIGGQLPPPPYSVATIQHAADWGEIAEPEIAEVVNLLCFGADEEAAEVLRELAIEASRIVASFGGQQPPPISRCPHGRQALMEQRAADVRSLLWLLHNDVSGGISSIEHRYALIRIASQTKSVLREMRRACGHASAADARARARVSGA